MSEEVVQYPDVGEWWEEGSHGSQEDDGVIEASKEGDELFEKLKFGSGDHGGGAPPFSIGPGDLIGIFDLKEGEDIPPSVLFKLTCTLMKKDGNSVGYQDWLEGAREEVSALKGNLDPWSQEMVFLQGKLLEGQPPRLETLTYDQQLEMVETLSVHVSDMLHFYIAAHRLGKRIIVVEEQYKSQKWDLQCSFESMLNKF